jgi:hypothetical protein
VCKILEIYIQINLAHTSVYSCIQNTPFGKYLTLAIKPNVNHEKDGQGVVITFRNRVQPCLYCMIQLGYMKRWIVIISSLLSPV